MVKIDKTYSISLEIREELLWYDMAIILNDVIDEKYKNDRMLHLLWKSKGVEFEFEGMHVDWPNLAILNDVDVLKLFVEITPRTQPREIERRLIRLNFERKIYTTPHVEQLLSNQNLHMLAQAYGIKVQVNQSILTYQYDGRLYPHPAWTTPQDSAYMRLFFAGIVFESKRQRASTHVGKDDLRDLLLRASAGDLSARNEIIEIGVSQMKKAYGINNLVLLQYVREVLQEEVHKSLEAPYPYQNLSQRGHHIVQTAVFKVYTDVLLPWSEIKSVGGSVVREVLNYYGELDEDIHDFR